MKKVIFVFCFILINLLSINSVYSQWNKVNEHFELQRAKNTKILSYTTYEEDNNLVVIDESGEINEYKMDTGELTKTCNCIKDSTFEYAQLLEDKETVVLGKKYIDSFIINKYQGEFYSYELFFINKYNCNKIKNFQLPLDSIFDSFIKGNYQLGYSLVMNIAKLDTNLKTLSLTFNLNRSFMNNGEPFGSNSDYCKTFEFDFNNNFKFLNYKNHIKLIDNLNLYSNNYKEAFLYGSVSVSSRTNRYYNYDKNMYVELLSNTNQRQKVINYEYSKSVQSTYPQPFPDIITETGINLDIFQILSSYNSDVINVRMKDSLKIYNLKTNRIDTTYYHKLFNQNLLTSKNYPIIIEQDKNNLTFYNFIDLVKLSDYTFNYDEISNLSLSDISDDILLIGNSSKLARYKSNNFKDISDEGFFAKNRVIYENQSVEFVVLSKLNNNEYIWEINGESFTTTNKEFQYNFKNTGLYSIKLIINSNGKKYEFNKNQYIKVKPTLKADFSYKYDDKADNHVFFEASKIADIRKIYWKIGNLTYLNGLTPDYKFENNGYFDVTLIVEDDLSADTITKTIFINSLLNSKEVVDNAKVTQINLGYNGNCFDIYRIKDDFVFLLNEISGKTYNLRLLKLRDNSIFQTKTINVCYDYNVIHDLRYFYFRDKELLINFINCNDSINKYTNIGFDLENDFNSFELDSNHFFKQDAYKTVNYFTNKLNRFYSFYSYDKWLLKNNTFDLDDYYEKYLYFNCSGCKFDAKDDFLVVTKTFESGKPFLISTYDYKFNLLIEKYINYKIPFRTDGVKFIDNENILIYGREGIVYNNYTGNSVLGIYNTTTKNYIEALLPNIDVIRQVEIYKNQYIIISHFNSIYIYDLNLKLIKNIFYSKFINMNDDKSFLKFFIKGEVLDIFGFGKFFGPYSSYNNYNFYHIVDSFTLKSLNLLGVQNQDKSEINIYPNPASDIATIDLSNIKQTNNEITISAYDVMGNKVANLFSGVFNSKNIEVDTRVLPIGNFMIVVSDGNQIISKQIAIMR